MGPLPGVWANKLDSLVYTFVKKGKLEMLEHSVLCNPVDKGGLGLICIRTKCDSLFLKQTLRMLDKPNTMMFKYIGYFAGKLLNRWPLARVPRCHTTTPHFQKIAELVMEAE